MDLTPLVRLLLAAALAGLIGLDRELRSKPAGLRTNIVVSVAAAAFTYIGAELFPGGDPTRVASQVVSGIGFLGGGAIFAAGGKPHGLTTAAALWGSAAVGLASGSGAYLTAITLVVVTLLTLWPLDALSSRFLTRFGRRDTQVHVILTDLATLPEIDRTIRGHGVRLLEIHFVEVMGALSLNALVSGHPRHVQRAIEDLRQREDLTYVIAASGDGNGG